MKNSEIQRLYRGLDAVKNLPGAKFAYVVGRNLTLLKSVIEAIDKALKLPEKYAEYEKEYEEKRLELCKLYAKTDEHGEPCTEPDPDRKNRRRYVFMDKKAFDGAIDTMLKELKEVKYAETFIEMKKNYEDWQKFLELESEEELKLFRVKSENLPEGITGEQIQGIIEIIE